MFLVIRKQYELFLGCVCNSFLFTSPVKHCRDLKVHVLVDAEFYSCKPAISAIALILMARHNGDYHHVGNTIQAYLKVFNKKK